MANRPATATVTIERTGDEFTATLTMPSGLTLTRRGSRSEVYAWVAVVESSAMGDSIAVKIIDRT